jgi:hypothetical protein
MVRQLDQSNRVRQILSLNAVMIQRVNGIPTAVHGREAHTQQRRHIHYTGTSYLSLRFQF